MNRTALVAASVLALCVGDASAARLPGALVSGRLYSFQVPEGRQFLYNQNSNYNGDGIDSQNFTSGTFSSYDDQGADDFVIPKDQLWTITEVDVSGVYFNGSGPANSENVIFYKSTKFGKPGDPVKKGTFNELDGKGGPNFRINLPGKGLQLKAGHYWVSVIANMVFQTEGEWGWGMNGTVYNDAAEWREDDGNRFGECEGWQQIDQCISGAPYGDFMFDLRGTSGGK